MKKQVIVKYWWWFCITTLLAKLAVACLGHNYDIVSWRIAGDLVTEGKNIYANTHRYNYAPLWGYLLGGIRAFQQIVFQSQSIVIFHLLVTFFLSWVDIGIALLLRKTYSLKAGFIFLINPVSLLLTGYHAQFDNVAVLLGLWAVINLQKSAVTKSIVGCALSLITKHFLLYFLPWLFFNKKHLPLWHRAKIVTLPVVLFVLSFMPFLINVDAQNAILQHVLGYEFGREYALLSRGIDKMWAIINPTGEPLNFNIIKLFYTAIILFLGWMNRRKPLAFMFPFYLLVIIAFAPQLCPQYLAIPLIAIVVFWKHWPAKVYLIYVFLYLLLDAPSNVGGFFRQWFDDYALYQGIAKALSGTVAQLILLLLCWHLMRPVTLVTQRRPIE